LYSLYSIILSYPHVENINKINSIPSRIFTEFHQLPSAPFGVAVGSDASSPFPPAVYCYKTTTKIFLSLLVLHFEKLLVVIAHARRCIALVDDAKKENMKNKYRE
jgi:hypothetical protein